MNKSRDNTTTASITPANRRILKEVRRVDVVLQCTGQHSWNLMWGWQSAAKQLGIFHRLFTPKSKWGDVEPEVDDGLYDYLVNPQADLVMLLGFDWHSQMLHTSPRWQERWQNAKFRKILYIHESIVDNCELSGDDRMKRAAISAAQCVDGIIYNDLTDQEFLESIHPATLWLPYGCDESTFVSTKPFAQRTPRAFFRGKTNPYNTNRTYQLRRTYIEHLQAHNAVDLLQYTDQRIGIEGIVKDYNEYQIALNMPTLGHNHPSRVTEAMGCGCALVTNRTFSARNDDVFKDQEHVLYYSNKDELLNAVGRLSSDPPFAERIGRQGREFVLENLTEAKVLQRIMDWSGRNELSGNFRRAPEVPTVSISSRPSGPGKILIDGVMFQVQHGRPLGISRVWHCLLKELARTELASRIVLLDRGQTAPRIPGIRCRAIHQYDFHSYEDESVNLQRICDEENAALFFSTYYSWPETTPSVLMIHDMIPEVRGMDLQELQWRAKAKAIQKATAYFSVSESTKSDFLRLFPQHRDRKLFLTPNAVTGEYRPHSAAEVERFKLKYNIQKPYFILTGMRILYKNALQFFKAFQLLENQQDYEIICTGGGKELEDLFLPYVRDTRCQVLFLTDDELSTAYSGALALAYPSQYEGFGLPIVEAQKSGCPVITCRNSSIPEVAGDSVFYVGEGDVAAMKTALAAIQNPEVRTPLIQAGLVNARRFSWKKTGQVVCDAIKELLKDVAKPPAPRRDPVRTLWRLAYVLNGGSSGAADLPKSVRDLWDMFTGRRAYDYLAILGCQDVIAACVSSRLEEVWLQIAPVNECESLLSYALGLAFEARQQTKPALERYIHALKVAPLSYNAQYKVRLGLRLASIAFQVGEFLHAKDVLNKVVLEAQRDCSEAILLLHQVNKAFEQDQKKAGSPAVDGAMPGTPVALSSSIGGASSPLVSVLVSAYNSERFIRGCLEDLEAQTIAEQVEIIVVDTASPQDERAIVEEFQQRYSNIVYLRTEERETVYGAWNRGLKTARGKYLTNANTDDRHCRDALERMAQALEANPTAALVYGDCLATTVENETFETTTSARELKWLDFDRQVLLEKGCFVGPQPMWRREVHEEHGYFDDKMVSSGDYEFWLRMARTCDFLHLNETLGLYLESPASVQHANNDLAIRESRRAQELHRDAIMARGKAPTPVTALRTAGGSGAIVLPPCALVGQLREAQQFFHQKKLPAAWGATRAALKHRPFHPEAYLLLAEIALAAQDSVAALACAQFARQIAPEFRPAKKFLKGKLHGHLKPEWLVMPEEIGKHKAESRNWLSVCLIVKNEERFLGQCLASVKGLAHQVVVVDTGSTDRTVEIAREHGAHVHSFAWCDDFSAARNAALEHATGDWVLMLDADEELPPDQHAALRKLLHTPSVISWRLPLQDVGREAEGCSYVPRLFRNAPGLFYAGRVHEQVFTSIEGRRQEWGLETRLGDATLRHYGYTKELTLERDKVGRNLRLLEQAVLETPGDTNLLMNYGLELTRSGRQEEGLRQYRAAFAVMAELPPALVSPEVREVLLTQFCAQLMAAKRHAEIVQVLASPLAKLGGGLTASLHFTLGRAQMELKQFAAAAEQFRQCLAKRGRPALTPVNLEIRKAGPRHCLARCLDQMGETDAAAEEFRLAIEADPQSRSVRCDHARFLAAHERQADALNLLFALANEKPTEARVWLQGGQLALTRLDFLEVALDWTAEAERHLPDDPAVVQQRAEALMLAGQCGAALPLWRRWPEASNHALAAALVLCETVAGENQFAPAAADEAGVSREFVKWYQRLLQFNARPTVEALNAKIDVLKRILPSAAGLLANVLVEAAADTADSADISA